MKTIVPLLLVAILVLSGCDWVPERDNPYDPQSQYYIPPPERNHPPVVESLEALSECLASGSSETIYKAAIYCWITDPDRNLVPESLQVFSSQYGRLGILQYNEAEQKYYLLCTPERFPNIDISDLYSTVITVRVQDDSGAVDSAMTNFDAITSGFPHPVHPAINNDYNVSVFPVRFGWDEWNGSRPHSFSIDIKRMNLYSVWDTAGILSLDTAMVCPFSDWENCAVSPLEFYVWYLTVVDERGNRITGPPASFKTFPPE